MKVKSFFVFLLLVAQRISLAVGDCIYNSHLRHCSCSIVDLANIMSVLSCIQATSFEFQGGRFEDSESYIRYSIEMEQMLAMIRIPLRKVTFVNIVLSEEFVSTFIKWVIRIPIRELAFENTIFTGRSNWHYINGSSPYISSLKFINVSSVSLSDRPKQFDFLSNWISKLEEITLMKSHLTNIPCNISLLFETLTSLDLSENVLQDIDISTSFCHGAFPNLDKLNLRQNNLMSYERICETLSKKNTLRHLDLSQNNISYSSVSLCEWQPSLVLLNLSSTGLEQIETNLPHNCEVLDLSYNKLSTINLSLHKLKELYLSHNRITTISDMGNFPLLQLLAVDWNPIETLQRSHLQYLNNLKFFSADNNQYICSCSFVHEINEIAKSDLIIQHWPDGYMCKSPSLHNGRLVKEVSHSFLECHQPLLIVIICFVILLICAIIVICIIKIQRSKRASSQNSQNGNINIVRFQS